MLFCICAETTTTPTTFTTESHTTATTPVASTETTATSTPFTTPKVTTVGAVTTTPPTVTTGTFTVLWHLQTYTLHVNFLFNWLNIAQLFELRVQYAELRHSQLRKLWRALKLHITQLLLSYYSVVLYLCRDDNNTYNVYNGVADYGKYPCSEYRDDIYVNTLHNTNGHHSRRSNNYTSNSNNRYFCRILVFTKLNISLKRTESTVTSKPFTTPAGTTAGAVTTTPPTVTTGTSTVFW